MYDNIPAEMRAYDQWVTWRFEERDSDKPTKVPYSPITNKHASVNDSTTWCSYDNAVLAVKNGMWNGIGFVLTEHDPYGFIDLDEPKQPNGQPLEPDEYQIRMDRQHKIYQEFDSYAELSPSGKGLHIIVKGSVESGRKRSSIEVYSNLRFMTMTGNVYGTAKPIRDHHETLNILWSEMGKGKEAAMYYAGLENPTETDDVVIQTASTAANGEKFHDLYHVGNWEKYYPSQSEADLSLINILAFYSHNRAQIQRIFLASKLGQREKSRAQYRINYALNKAFDRILPPIDMDGLRNQLNAAIEKNNLANKPPAIQLSENYLNLPAPVEYVEPSNSIYSRPDGLLGEIAEYIYSQAPLPVAEIAIAAAIGLMAGICGKAYNISNTGLNQYVMLLALTGCGKEGMAGGISKLMTEVKKTVPTAQDFIGPSSISSEQAMIKYLTNTSSCFVSIFGEFALTLKQMSADNAAPHMLGLRKMFLDLYNKSGAGDEAQGIAYSDQSKNTTAVKSPAFSVLCESSPEIYYSALEESMISGGLLPRFITIEYKGDRVRRNVGASLVRPSFDLVQKVATLSANCMQLMHHKKVCSVKQDKEAEEIISRFEEFAHNNIVGSKEIRRQLWNRAVVKVLKLAALIAVGVNPFDPVINRHAATWAIEIVIADIKNLSIRFETGDVGSDNDETQQLLRTIEVFKDYVIKPLRDLESYGVKGNIHAERIVPYGYLQKRLVQIAPFRRDRQGATAALKRVLATLIQRGDIQEVPRAKLVKDFGVTAICYMITTPKAFGI